MVSFQCESGSSGDRDYTHDVSVAVSDPRLGAIMPAATAIVVTGTCAKREQTAEARTRTVHEGLKLARMVGPLARCLLVALDFSLHMQGRSQNYNISYPEEHEVLGGM